MTADPWLDVVYITNASGLSQGSAIVNTGLTLSELDGRAFVVHELTSGARIACGILSTAQAAVQEVESAVASDFASYPGYTGNLAVAGTVNISKLNDSTQTLVWDLTGVDTACVAGAADDVTNGCGVHVHTGTSCAVASEVGGHYFNSSSMTTDPWLNIVYVADNSGSSKGSATVTTGLTLSELVGRAFVVHELDSGARVGCAVLGAVTSDVVDASSTTSASEASSSMSASEASSSTSASEASSSTSASEASSSTNAVEASSTESAEASSSTVEVLSTTVAVVNSSSSTSPEESSEATTATPAEVHLSSDAVRVAAKTAGCMSLLAVFSSM